MATLFALTLLARTAAAYEDTALNAEADATLTLPTGGLGPGPGFRLSTDAHLQNPSALAFGLEMDLRLPSSGDRELSSPRMANDATASARLLVFGGGPRVMVHLGNPERAHFRVGGAVGLALVRLVTDDPAGVTIQEERAFWARPQAGVVVPVGPGALTGSALLGFAPADLRAFRGSNGGLAFGLGYRLTIARRNQF